MLNFPTIPGTNVETIDQSYVSPAGVSLKAIAVIGLSQSGDYNTPTLISN